MTATTATWAAVLVGLFGIFWALSKVSSTLWRRCLRTAVVGAVLVAGAIFAYNVALGAGDRSARSLALGPVSYERYAIDTPQEQVLHIATVDLDNPCVHLTTTRPMTGGLVEAETGTEFVDRTGAALSINVAFFRGLEEFSLFNATQSGDLLTAIGAVVIDGEQVGVIDTRTEGGLSVTDGRASAIEIPPDADFAVRGRTALVANGEMVAPNSPAYARSIAGVDTDTNELVLLVSDGKQPGYAVGSTYRQLAELLVERGVDEAIEFDGGGSATMVATVEGRTELLNRPSHQRIPGRQRPVATHLGVMVEPGCASTT